MLFVKNEPFFILTCAVCKGVGAIGITPCRECKGKCLAQMPAPDTLWYFGQPLTRFHISLSRVRRRLDQFRIFGALILSFGFFGFFGWSVWKTQSTDLLYTSNYWLKGPNQTALIFWFGVYWIFYLLYRAIKLNPEKPKLQVKKNLYKSEQQDSLTSLPFKWSDVKNFPKKHRIDISKHWSDEAMHILEEAYATADGKNASSVSVPHIFAALLKNTKVKMIFIRLGIPLRVLEAKVAALYAKNEPKKDKASMPLYDEDGKQVLFHSFASALKFGSDIVEVSDLLGCVVRQSEDIQNILYDMSVDEQKLQHVIAWVRIRETLRRRYREFRRAAAHHNKYGLDKAMTAVATPYLNGLSKDLTMQAAVGNISPCVAREKEMEEIFRAVEAGRQGILIVGDPGVGKMSMIEGLAEAMVEGNVPARLYDKRLVLLSNSSLLAGTTVSGAQERLIQMVREVRRAGNIILVVNNMHELMSVRSADGTGMDVSETIAEYMGGKNMLLIATTTRDGYNRSILNSEIGTIFSPVQLKEMNEDQAIEVLESKAGSIEYKQQIFFSYDSVSASVRLASKFLRDQNLPESAIGLMTEAASYVRSKRGVNQLVEGEDVAAIVGEKTGIPTTSISESESKKLLRLEEEMHKRVVGQEEAVSLVANALRRARAEIRNEHKPIANFLFLGPTGVGKTELAKTIAEVYFGGEDRMIRLDMSEFQDVSAVGKLIGENGRQGTGILTEAVRQHPFSLVLLDELEKADPNVLNIFLQVFDDGRLTDSVGRVIDFTNTIIIATSNAGTDYLQEQIRQNVPLETIRQALIRGQLKQYYRPELLNRFDAIVLFKVLAYEDILHIAEILLRRVGKDLEKRGVDLRVEPEALRALADVGFDPEFGARPMRRAIQDKIENALAELILGDKLHRRDTVVIGENASVRVETAK